MLPFRINPYVLWLPLWILILGCQSANISPVDSADPSTTVAAGPSNQGTNTGGGVIDASGGDLNKSTEAEVREAVRTLPYRLSIVLNRMKMVLKEDYRPRISPSFVPTKTDEAEEGFDVVGSFFPQTLLGRRAPMPNASAFSEAFLDKYFGDLNSFMMPAEELAESGHLKIKLVDGDCHCKVSGPKDASANIKGEICFSLSRLRQIPAISLPVATTALGAHELAHVLGFEEAEAQKIQDLIEWDRESLFISSEVKLKILKDFSRVDSQFHVIQKKLEYLPLDDEDEEDYDSLAMTHDEITEALIDMEKGVSKLNETSDLILPREQNYIGDLQTSIESLKQKVDKARKQEALMKATELSPAEALELKVKLRTISGISPDGKMFNFTITEPLHPEPKTEDQVKPKATFTIKVGDPDASEDEESKIIHEESSIHTRFEVSRMGRSADYDESLDSIAIAIIELADRLVPWLYGIGLTNDQIDLLIGFEEWHPEFKRIIRRVDELALHSQEFLSVSPANEE